MFTSLFDSFKPIFYISVIFGTMPLYYSKKPFIHLKFSKIRSFFLVICLTCVLIHGITTPAFFMKTKRSTLLLEPDDVSTTNSSSTYVKFIRNQTSAQLVTMKVINHLINTFMGICSYLVGLIFVSKKLPIFIAHLTEIDRGLVPFVRFNPRCNIYICWSLLAYFSIMSLPIYVFYLYIVYTQENIFGFKLWSSFLLFCIAASFTTEIQFLNWALCIQYRCKAINNFLDKYSSQDGLFNSYIQISNQKQWNVKQRLTLRRIELAHQCYRKLCDLIKDLNYMYQLQLLFSVAGCFIKILFNVYFALFASLTNEKKNSEFSQTVNTFLWTTYYFVRFLVTIVVACKTSSEANKTRSVVSCVNSRSFDSDIKEELNMFLLHTTNQTFKFTACGLFTLSTQLITSAIAAGTTYLVILIQFRPPVN